MAKKNDEACKGCELVRDLRTGLDEAYSLLIETVFEKLPLESKDKCRECEEIEGMAHKPKCSIGIGLEKIKAVIDS